MLTVAVLLLLKLALADCFDPCEDCRTAIDVLQYRNMQSVPITVGASSLYDYSNVYGNSASSFGTDGWFNTTSASPLFLRSNQVWQLPSGCDEFILEASLTFQSQLIEGVVESPLGINQDPVYGAGVLGLDDVQSGWSFRFILTNTRIYALLEHQNPDFDQPTPNSFYSFTYAIPIACRRPKSINQYRLILKAACETVWFQVDGKDLLKVQRPGRPPISEKFLISRSGGITDLPGFPTQVAVAIGLWVQGRGAPHGVCQGGIFDSQTDSIYSAKAVQCCYAPYQSPMTFLMDLKLRYFELSVMRTYCAEECLEPCCGDCGAEWKPPCYGRVSSSSSSSSSHGCSLNPGPSPCARCPGQQPACQSPAGCPTRPHTPQHPNPAVRPFLIVDKETSTTFGGAHCMSAPRELRRRTGWLAGGHTRAALRPPRRRSCDLTPGRLVGLDYYP